LIVTTLTSPDAVVSEISFVSASVADESTSVAVSGPPDATVIPPLAVVKARQRLWCDAEPPYPARLDQAAVKLGFRAGSFEGFTKDLDAFCRAEPQTGSASILNWVLAILGIGLPLYLTDPINFSA